MRNLLPDVWVQEV